MFWLCMNNEINLWCEFTFYECLSCTYTPSVNRNYLYGNVTIGGRRRFLSTEIFPRLGLKCSVFLCYENAVWRFLSIFCSFRGRLLCNFCNLFLLDKLIFITTSHVKDSIKLKYSLMWWNVWIEKVQNNWWH